MKKKFTALLGLNLKAMLTSFSGSNNGKKRKVSGLLIVGLMALLSIYISGVYSFLLAESLAPVHMLDLVPVFIALMSCILSLMFTAFAASGIIFGGKDMDLMFSLPVSAFSVMLSKLLALYLENLLFTVFMLVPAGVAYLFYGGQGGFYFFAALLVSALFLALVSTLLSCLGGLLLGFIQSRTNTPLLSILGYLVFMALVFAFAFQINNIIANMAAMGGAVDSALSTWLLPFGLFRSAIFGNLLSLLGLAAVTLLPFLLVVYLFSLKYKAILTKITSHASRSDYKLGAMAARSQFSALFRKEAGRFFSTPIYLFNCGIGAMMAIGASVFACFQKDATSLLLAQMPGLSLATVLALVIGFMFAMTCPASASISLEGKNLWILKEAPIPAKTLFLVKGGLNALLIWGTSLLCLPLLWYSMSLTAGEVLTLACLCAALGLFIPGFGLVDNLLFPKMDSVNDMLVVKQSMASMISVFGMFAVVGIGVGLYFLLGSVLGDLAFLLCYSALLALAGVGLWAWVFRKGTAILQQL